jgi:alcohol dehydrogenase class IV
MAPVPDFRNHLPVRIDFGCGALDRLGEVLTGEGAHAPFLIVDPFLLTSPLVSGMLTDLERRAMHVIVAEVAPGEPTLASVDARRWTPPRGPGRC